MRKLASWTLLMAVFVALTVPFWGGCNMGGTGNSSGPTSCSGNTVLEVSPQGVNECVDITNGASSTSATSYYGVPSASNWSCDGTGSTGLVTAVAFFEDGTGVVQRNNGQLPGAPAGGNESFTWQASGSTLENTSSPHSGCFSSMTGITGAPTTGGITATVNLASGPSVTLNMTYTVGTFRGE